MIQPLFKLPTTALIVLILACCAGVSSAQNGGRHVEKAGGFSFIAPQGWRFTSIPGMKYAVAIGPRHNDFAANINVVDQTYAGSVDDYVRANMKALKRIFKDFKMVGESDFTTDSGSAGKRVVIEDNQNDKRLRQLFYFLADGSRKFIITYTATAEVGAKYDAPVDESIKSFQFDK